MAAPLRRIVGAAPLAAALLIAIVGPLGYVVDRWYDDSSALAFEAKLGAGQVARFIYAHPTMWQYQGLRIAEVIALPDAYAALQSVRDVAGHVVLENGPPIDGPALRAEAPIFVAGTEVGKFTVASGLGAFLTASGMVTGVCWTLAVLVYLAVRGLPIRALDRALEEAARQKGRFEAAVENMTQGLCMLDAQGCIVVLNRRFIEMFDLGGAGSLIGMSAVAAAERLNGRGGLAPALCRQLLLPPPADGPQVQRRVILELDDGRTVAMDRRGIEQGGWLTTVRDVSAQLRAERAETEAALMRERAGHAQAASHAKSMFLATMSHEVRTPMNGILGLASVLLDEKLTEDQRKVVETIRYSGDSLMRILNDILEFSKLEAGHVVFETLPFSPAVVSQSVEDVLDAPARAKGLHVTNSAEPDVPVWVVGDAGRIRQTLLNLVGNAIKFTAQGEVAVSLSCHECRDGSATLEWRVRDTGIGMAANELGNVFHDFAQADASIGRRFGGSGLGLAICKRLVEQMGGAIGAESVVGQGSTFWFRLSLPLPPVGTMREQPRRDAVEGLRTWLKDRASKPRLLLAEDNPTNQFVLRRMVASLGLEMDAVGDGAEAVAAVSSFAYAAVLMDVQMPKMDGLEATRAIRALPITLRGLPIIALTGNAFAEDQQACRDAGMDDFLTKPLDKETLAGALLRALAYGRSQADGSVGRANAARHLAAADAPACTAAE